MCKSKSHRRLIAVAQCDEPGDSVFVESISLVDSGSEEELTVKNQLCRLDQPPLRLVSWRGNHGESYSIVLTLHTPNDIRDAPAIARLDIAPCIYGRFLFLFGISGIIAWFYTEF